MAEQPTEVAALDGHRDFRTAVPTPDHYIPLLYLAGLAGAAQRGADVLVDGYTYGSLSMTAYTLDLTCPGAGDGTEPAAAMPDGVPMDGSNI
jgi:4,5-DOPA dioxygenase extradiol